MLSSQLLIERVILSGPHPSVYCDIDLTHPANGEPLREICLIGMNGTGKSNVLKILHRSVSPSTALPEGESDHIVLTKVRTDGGSFFRLHCDSMDREDDFLWYHVTLEEDESWSRLAATPLSIAEFVEVFQDHRCYPENHQEHERSNEDGLTTAFFSPYESWINGVRQDDYTGFIDGLVRDRDTEFFSFLKQEENRSKTVEEVELDFQQVSPSALSALKEIWDQIIGPAGLSFEAEGNGRLISHKDGREVPFSNLCRGLQQAMLATGQLLCRYIHQKNKAGFLFLDEPEAGLHPELQCVLINLYRAIVRSHPNQLFVSTNSPLIATRFPDYSRILLSLDHQGVLNTSRGIAAEGSDPNQILRKDFGLQTVQPEKPKGKTGSYSKLKRAIRESDEQEDELADLIDQVVTIRGI